MATGNNGQQTVNLGEFFNMGGYALYVWGSYVIACILVGVNILLAKRRLRRATQEIGRS